MKGKDAREYLKHLNNHEADTEDLEKEIRHNPKTSLS